MWRRHVVTGGVMMMTGKVIRPASSGKAYFVLVQGVDQAAFLVYTSLAFEPGDLMTFEPKRDGLGRPCWVHGVRLRVGVAR